MENTSNRVTQDKSIVVAAPTADQKGKIGTTCHQCRQKIKGLSAHCTNTKKDKPCPNKFCHKCLRNRYGEQAEEKSVLMDWHCPKCRGICNCSVCMKRRGQQPTGILVNRAKLNNEPSDGSSSKVEIENSVGTEPLTANGKTNKRKCEILNDLEEISLTRGAELTTIAGINLPQEDVGHALQFLEFCTAFKEVFDLKEVEPVSILLELIHGRNGCREEESPVIRLHIFLLSMIQNDMENKSPVLTHKSGKGSWRHVLRNCLSKSGALFEISRLDGFNFEVDEYENLSSSTRLRILNFLCDEVLCHGKLRSWIREHNKKCTENAAVSKELSKERIKAAKHKKKQLKLKMQDDVAKAVLANNGVRLSTFERKAIESEIKSEIAEAQAEVVEAEKMATTEKQSREAAGTKPLISDINGHTYWKLKGYADDSNIFLQVTNIGTTDGSVRSEKWFTMDAEQAKEVEEHIRSLREREVEPQHLKFTYVTKPDEIL